MTSPQANPDLALEAEVASLFVSTLNLDMAATDIDPTASLFGEGLGLDSIDILEIAMVVSKRYGLQIKADSKDNVRIFTSLRSLTAHIAEHRTQ
jgi:acyl carrier protein